MNNGFLEGLLKKLNNNKGLLKSNMEAFSNLMEQGRPNMLPAAQGEMENKISPNSLMVNMRRTKGSIPVGKLSNGNVVFSDGSVANSNDTVDAAGEQTGFASLKLPSYGSEEGQEAEQISLEQAPTERLSNAFMTPQAGGDAQQLTPEIEKTAYDLFMEESGKIPSILREEIDKYLKTDTQEDKVVANAEDRLIIAQDQNINQPATYQAPVRYGQRVIPNNAFINNMATIRTKSYRDLLQDYIGMDNY